MKKILIPCSGIGKAVGSVAREAALLLTDGEHSNDFTTICLPLLMTDDEKTRKEVMDAEVYTIDGCSKKCASVLVKHVGAKPVREIMVLKILARNREHKPNSVIDIGEGGRLLAKDIVNAIIEKGGSN